MSNSIWKMPDQKPEKENHIVLVGAWASCLWYGGEKPEEIFWENVKRWAYLEDIIAQADKAERLQKAVDKALHYLDAEYHAYIMVHQKEPELIATVLEEIKQLIKETTNDK